MFSRRLLREKIRAISGTCSYNEGMWLCSLPPLHLLEYIQDDERFWRWQNNTEGASVSDFCKGTINPALPTWIFVRMNLNPYFTLYVKINSRWILGLNGKDKTIACAIAPASFIIKIFIFLNELHWYLCKKKNQVSRSIRLKQIIYSS